MGLGEMKTGGQRERGGECSKKYKIPVRLSDLSAKSKLWTEWVGLVRESSRRELGESACYNPACRQRGQFCSSLKG